ncbi:hypothetical protein [Nitrosovibrio sp. Nv4]|uniref:hypothetical protein n=1 Tax=Nitrosovibrio sp. Nv4 TaxID=1945880 RepID=UPI000BD42247|nr:hypothetical protein [Nitrosovibrio sp. Nv4]SOD42598.1 hypothetical protein SAMN06298226_2949 [Nitrosovibrio sp. Nv4]
MLKLRIAFVAVVMLASGQSQADFTSINAEQMERNAQPWQPRIPHYNLNPQNRLEVMENYAIESREIATAAIYQQRMRDIRRSTDESNSRTDLYNQLTELTKENTALREKAKTLDDLSRLIRSSGMTQEEFTSWLEAMRLSHQDPTRSSAIVKSILNIPR